MRGPRLLDLQQRPGRAVVVTEPDARRGVVLRRRAPRMVAIEGVRGRRGESGDAAEEQVIRSIAAEEAAGALARILDAEPANDPPGVIVPDLTLVFQNALI